MATKTKQKKWILPRHKVVVALLRPFFSLYTRLSYGVKPEKVNDDRAYLVLLNHQTAFDQFFVSLSFPKPVYYIASEDLFSNGWISSAIRYLVAPIPIKKQTTDIAAVMTCIRVAREGGTIAIAPEGNRTYSGKLVYMSDSIAPLAKKLKLPIALYRIEGGYGVQPRWSDGLRRGKLRAYVSQVIEPEEYQQMSNEELFDKIREGLNVDEAVADHIYRSRKQAEYLERAMYVCPFCGLAEFESRGNDITCKTCGRVITHNADKTLSGQGFTFPFRFVHDWYAHQEKFVNSLDVTAMTEEALYQDTVRLSEVIVCKKKNLLRKAAKISLYGNRMVIDEGTDKEETWMFDDINVVTVLGRNKLNVYYGKQLLQFKGSKRFNALKYVHIFYRYKNIVRGNPDAEFLGL